MKHWLSSIRTYLGDSRSLRNEELYKFNIYVIFNLLVTPIFLSFAFHHLMKAEYEESLRDGTTAVFLFVSLLLIFSIQRKIIIYLINVSIVQLAILHMFFKGGQDGEKMLWMYTIPLGAFFLLGRKKAFPFILISYLGIGLVFYDVRIFSFLPYLYPSEVKMRFLVTYSLICIFAYIYQSVSHIFQQYLQNEQKKLQQEISKRKEIEEMLQRSHEELEMRVEQRTAELAKAKEEAEVANLAKNNFLCSISHELRTPLNHILGFAQLLEMRNFGLLNEKQAHYVKRIMNSGQHLLSLINDVLDVSQVNLGKMEFHLGKVNIKHLLEGSLATIRKKDMREDLFFHLVISKDLENIEILADEQKLKQIMFNLLSNAVKFTPDSGTISVEVEQGETSLIIDIIDSGIGIAPEEQEKIFVNFYQVQGGLRDKTPGTGLGLPITRRLVELHGGKIWVKSNGEGQGSQFSFSLPLTINNQQSK